MTATAQQTSWESWARDRAMELNLSPNGDIRQGLVSRLKKSKLESETSARNGGYDCGMGWAIDGADYTELVKLSDERPSMDWLEEHGECAFEELAKLIGRDDDVWDEILGDHDGDDPRLRNLNFLAGFVDGAMTVWDDVKNEV